MADTDPTMGFFSNRCFMDRKQINILFLILKSIQETLLFNLYLQIFWVQKVHYALSKKYLRVLLVYSLYS